MSQLPFARFKLFTEAKLLFSALSSARSRIIFLNVSAEVVSQFVSIYWALSTVTVFLKRKDSESGSVSAFRRVIEISSFKRTFQSGFSVPEDENNQFLSLRKP
jgi:hypothetical protein